MKLTEFEFKNVRIECPDGQVFEGYVSDYVNPYDNENNKESILLEPFKGFPLYGGCVEFYAKDIKTISIIE